MFKRKKVKWVIDFLRNRMIFFFVYLTHLWTSVSICVCRSWHLDGTKGRIKKYTCWDVLDDFLKDGKRGNKSTSETCLTILADIVYYCVKRSENVTPMRGVNRYSEVSVTPTSFDFIMISELSIVCYWYFQYLSVFFPLFIFTLKSKTLFSLENK